MDFGFSLSQMGSTANPDEIVSLAKHGEKLGFHAVTLGDHIVVSNKINSPYPYEATGKFPSSGEFLDQLTTLSFLAAKTNKIRIMTGVMVLPLRHPIIAAKMLATIDVLSKGRLTVGVGVG